MLITFGEESWIGSDTSVRAIQKATGRFAHVSEVMTQDLQGYAGQAGLLLKIHINASLDGV
ncbi:MAG: hypothetical protein ACR2O2_01485 [Ruegeria sp.]